MWGLVLALLAQAQEVEWITPSDYPREAVAKQLQGTVTYEVDVDERGRVKGCAVVESSGSPVLDEATCRLIIRRAWFKPAGLPGLEKPSKRTSKHRWVLPPELMHPKTLADELEKAADEIEAKSPPQ